MLARSASPKTPENLILQAILQERRVTAPLLLPPQVGAQGRQVGMAPAEHCLPHHESINHRVKRHIYTCARYIMEEHASTPLHVPLPCHYALCSTACSNTARLVCIRSLRQLIHETSHEMDTNKLVSTRLASKFTSNPQMHTHVSSVGITPNVLITIHPPRYICLHTYILSFI